MKYELLLIDADDTIFDYDKAEAYAFSATCRDFDVPYDEARHLPVYRRINEAMWRALERGEMTQEQLAAGRATSCRGCSDSPPLGEPRF